MEIMNVPQAAEYLGRSHSTIYRWAQSGAIPVTRLGGTWVFSKTELDEFVAAKPRVKRGCDRCDRCELADTGREIVQAVEKYRAAGGAQ